MNKKREIITAVVLLLGLLVLGITHYFPNVLEGFYNPKNHLSFHILFEIISISIAFAIAMQGLMIFTHTLSRHRLFIGALFYCLATIDILHVLSYNGMPFFLMENSVLMPTWFWIVSRFILSIGLFVILLPKDKPIARKYRFYVFSLSSIITLGIAIVVYGFGDYLPTLVIEGQGVTLLKKQLEYILSFLFFTLMIALILKYRKTKNNANLMMIAAVGFAFLSEIIFTFYQSVHDFDNFLGHIYKMISYYFLMQGLYAATIREPFKKQRQMQLALSKSEQRLNTIVSTVPSGILITDSNGIIEYVNHEVEKIIGYSSKDLLHHSIRDQRWNPISINEKGQSIPCAASNNLKASQNHEAIFMMNRKDGESVFLAINSADMVNHDGERSNIIYSFKNITDLMKAQEKINELAFYDELTRLPNRYYLNDQIESLLKNNPKDKSIALVLLNLNRFRTVNDSLGNDVGDAFITTIATRLKDYCDSRNLTAFRNGGDEFAFILSEVKSDRYVEEIVKGIQELMQQPLLARGFKIHLDASMGISYNSMETKDSKHFLQKATIAMHEAKKNGQPYLFYYKDADKKLYEDIVLENELRRAIDQEELELYYQPQVDLSTGKLMGVEALIRWNHPERGMISPGRFIPLAEETGLIVPIGNWVIAEACRQIKTWHDNGYACKRISVNLSMRQFFQEDLIDTVSTALARSNIEPQYLELEITESMTMDVERAISMLKRLKEIGVRIAIDDFGTGYSSFSNLHLFPVDQLKIDQSFIRNLATNQKNEAIVGTIISLGHHLRLELMAEGVETSDQADFLSTNHCNGIQGYLISKPLPARELEKLFWNDILYNKKIGS